MYVENNEKKEFHVIVNHRLFNVRNVFKKNGFSYLSSYLTHDKKRL